MEIPPGFSIVIEVKTTDVYSIKTATLVGYVDNLISKKEIEDWDHALGIYVIDRSEHGLTQLENSIMAEKRTHQLRVISVTSLLLLARLLKEYDVDHEDILTILKPPGHRIDFVVGLMSKLVAEVEAPGMEASGKSSISPPVPSTYFL